MSAPERPPAAAFGDRVTATCATSRRLKLTVEPDTGGV